MRKKDPQALKSKHYGPRSLVPKVTSPLHPDTVRHHHEQSCLPEAFRPSATCFPASAHPFPLVSTTLRAADGELAIQITASLAQKRLGSTPDLLLNLIKELHGHLCRHESSGREEWINRDGSGGAASFRARDHSSPVLGTLALLAKLSHEQRQGGPQSSLSKEGQHLKLYSSTKTSPRAGSPWASTRLTLLVTLWHYFQYFWRQTWQQVFLRKLQPQAPTTPTAEEHNLRSPQKVSTCAYPTVTLLLYLLLATAAGRIHS